MDSKKRNRQRGEGRSLMRSSDDMPPPPNADSPKSIRDTATWKASQQGINRIWANYKNVLATSFNRMTRAEQESLITRLCVIITIGVTVLGFLLFYNFIPRMIRVFAVPGAIFAAWWAGNRIVSAVVLGRMEDMLNKE